MIGERIAARRQQIGWTQTDLARAIGVAPSRISAFENGTKTDCNLSTAKRIARALGCSIDYFADTWEDEAVASKTPALPLLPTRRGRPRKTALLVGARC